MANKRLSELNELQAIEIQPDDLTLTTDLSAMESKKLRFQSVKNWILNDPGSITASLAWNALSASYLIYTGRPNGTASFAISSSYARSASWAAYSLRSKNADTASYVSGAYAASQAISASYALSASYARSASWADRGGWSKYSETASYIWFTGVPNGTASYALNAQTAISAAIANVYQCETASYLRYTGIPNGTASYSFLSVSSSYAKSASYALSASFAYNGILTKSSSFLIFDGNPNGTASYAMKAKNSDSSSYVNYYGYDNGTVYRSINSDYSSIANTADIATNAFNADYSISSSYAKTASYLEGSASYANVAGVVLDTNMYRIYGPYSSKDSGGTNTTSEGSIQNFIISPPTVAGTTVIIMALADIKIPMTNSDTDLASVSLYIDYTEPGNTHSYGPLDTSKPNNYVGITAMSGAIALTGYNRQSVSLGHDWPNISGSWFRLRVQAAGGATLDTTRGVTFFVYTKTNTTLTKTAYPPF